MAGSIRARHIGLAAALALTLVAVALVGREDDEASPAAPAAPVGIALAEPQAAAIDLARLAARKGGAASADPFRTLGRPEPEEEADEPPAPEPPRAPPLPFAYIGRYVDGDRVVLFLTQGEESHAVREGDTIDGVYRVDSITEARVQLTYLPLNQRQELLLGGNP